MSKKTVLVDMDDVLINLNETTVNYLNSVGFTKLRLENFVVFKLNDGIDVSKLPNSQRNLCYNGLGCPRDIILEAYKSDSVFKLTKFYDGVYESMKKLCDNFNVIIHTHSLSSDVAKFKIDLLESMFSDLDITINLCVGRYKPPIQQPYAVFEDCLENLLKYNDSVCEKILIDKPWNRELFNSELISSLNYLHRVNNFTEGVEYLLSKE